jgi:hypothetical protein
MGGTVLGVVGDLEVAAHLSLLPKIAALCSLGLHAMHVPAFNMIALQIFGVPSLLTTLALAREPQNRAIDMGLEAVKSERFGNTAGSVSCICMCKMGSLGEVC